MAERFAEVIGDPIAHSKSPLIHGFWLAKLKFDGDYRATHVRPEDLAAYIAARRKDPDWLGCNVTVPHKEAIVPHVDALTETAREVGAVNLVFGRGRLTGGNTDVAGIVNALGPAPVERVCLIGSGGAALAAVAAFRLMGVRHLGLNVRNQAKGAALLERSGLAGRVGPVDDPANLAGADLIVNASILGMTGQSAMPARVLEEVARLGNDDVTVFDMVYAPLETPLLAAARGRGLRTVDGLAMLIGQAADAFQLLFGAAPPRQDDIELRALLTS